MHNRISIRRKLIAIWEERERERAFLVRPESGWKKDRAPSKIYKEGWCCVVISELTSVIFSWSISVLPSSSKRLKIWHILKASLSCVWTQKKRQRCALSHLHLTCCLQGRLPRHLSITDQGFFISGWDTWRQTQLVTLPGSVWLLEFLSFFP